MELVFFSFKHRYRKKELNNFLATRIYGKYFILNLGGPFKHIFAKVLMFLKIGKAISCDGRPLIADKSKGINFWLRGITLNIPNDFKKLNNNFVHIYNPLFEENKVFQIYPIKIKKTLIQKDLKIIYISRVNIDTNFEDLAVKEASKLNIPIVAIVDTNSDPTRINFPIPGNDDARRAINLYCDLIKKTILDAQKHISRTDEEDLKTETKNEKSHKKELKKEDSKKKEVKKTSKNIAKSIFSKVKSLTSKKAK